MHDNNGFDDLPLTRADVQREVINTLGAIQQSNALVAQQKQNRNTQSVPEMDNQNVRRIF